ncbi:hypothetical protein D7V82_08155 [bacterium 1xD8-6]|nr:hypothetical protein D7V72_09720 [bacterium D16-36]RKI70270.1 hypothetical protein D7V82_08155 [bacterium 1xD8-6]
MKLEFIPKFIMLLAGAVVSIITIINDMDVTYSLELLLATLIIFYIIGLIAKKIIQKVMESNMFVKQQAGDTEMEDIDIPTQDWVEGVPDADMDRVSGE